MDIQGGLYQFTIVNYLVQTAKHEDKVVMSTTNDAKSK